MGVMSIRLDDKKRKTLKAIASLEGKTISSIVSELVEEYIRQKRNKIIELAEKENLSELMKLSESSFGDWANKEDEVYNDL